MTKVKVYDNKYLDGEVVARVNYNEVLDYWDGSNWSNGGTGLHKGITKLKSTGKYVIIIGSQWQDSQDYGYIVSCKEALDEILNSEQLEVLEKYKDLKAMSEKLESMEIDCETKNNGKINVWEDGEIVARVGYNNNLDYWDGSNWSNGGTGNHGGLTRLKNGKYVLIYGTQWQGERNSAEIITADEARDAIKISGNTELYGLFPELEKIGGNEMIKNLKEDNTIELLQELGKINIDFIDEDLETLIEVLRNEFGIETEIQNRVNGQYLVNTEFKGE